jgi:hypothetical protein
MPGPAKNRQMLLFGTFLASLFAPLPSTVGMLVAQPVAPTPAAPPGIRAFSYSDLADLSLTAQVVAGVTVIKAERLKGELAPNLAAGRARFLIEAQTGMLLRGADGLSGTVTYIVDVPLDAKGKVPKLKKARFILFANRVPGRPQEVRLTSPYSQLDWTQTTESTLRAILTESTAAAAPPLVTGIGNAFHVPGAIPGESESQIFLTTADNRPISLSILRRPGEQPQWAVALGEMVDDSARAPAKDTLLWYRLACFLPARLPAKAVSALSATDAEAVRADYRHVLTQLGPCGRTIER